MSTPTVERRTGQSQPTVLSRIQGLFPLSPQHNANATLSSDGDLARSMDNDMPSSKLRALDPKFLKIRVVTWNMHDSLPKGDLEELLGRVPLYNSANAQPGVFSRLANDSTHPFHLVVVAGQECPTPSGIPMGLSAGFKLLDKDREKSREGDKDDRASSRPKEKERGEDFRGSKEDVLLEYPPSGWTQMVEDWLCHGGGSLSRTGSPSTGDIGVPRPLIRQKSAKEPRKGPYQLLVKDRLMGIYLAIYIHRDLKPLVRGMSKAAVTAGLIGGRLGNKGGVGISLNLDGTTLLFLNAHLAAHEGRVNHRLANLSKIKAELEVETFLDSDDPRSLSEDLTDKFDFTFLFGDLNFRLDISRLHADWLISRREYTQAFEFDQLNAVMKKGAFFDGFQEAPINFPPTFKYDVLRTIKRPKHAGAKSGRAGDQTPLAEVEEREPERGGEEDPDEATDAASLVSSSISSMNSGAQTDHEDYFQASPSTPTLVINSSNKLAISAVGANKAKGKWLSLLSPSFVHTPKALKVKHAESWSGPLTPTTPNSALLTPPLSAMTPTSSSVTSKRRFLRPPPMVLLNSSPSLGSFVDETNEEEKGIYDSSSKKRVPSWCDRILWKTTVPKDVTSVEDTDDQGSNTRQKARRVSHFFANAFRSPSSRHNTPLVSGVFTDGDMVQNGASSAGVVAPVRRDPKPPLTAIPGAGFKRLEPNRLRRANTTVSPPPTAPLPIQISPRRSTVGSPLSADRPQSATPSFWRFLPAFLSPSNNNQTTSLPEVQISTPPAPSFVKGDVVCLEYTTLDDKGMRKLEGRSDHRPVIGAYAVYI